MYDLPYILWTEAVDIDYCLKIPESTESDLPEVPPELSPFQDFRFDSLVVHSLSVPVGTG